VKVVIQKANTQAFALWHNVLSGILGQYFLLSGKPIIEILAVMAASPMVQLISPLSDSRLNIVIRGWRLAFLLHQIRKSLLNLSDRSLFDTWLFHRRHLA